MARQRELGVGHQMLQQVAGSRTQRHCHTARAELGGQARYRRLCNLLLWGVAGFGQDSGRSGED